MCKYNTFLIAPAISIFVKVAILLLVHYIRSLEIHSLENYDYKSKQRERFPRHKLHLDNYWPPFNHFEFYIYDICHVLYLESNGYFILQ